jgi:hypothetical protein
MPGPPTTVRLPTTGSPALYMVIVTLVILLLTACGTRTDPPPAEPEPARARAALATVHIDNRSPHRVAIFYRIAARGDAEVGIGQVAAHGFATLAPVPAGEPLRLIARIPSGAELLLPARAFVINGEWTWVIPVDADFVQGHAGDQRE